MDFSASYNRYHADIARIFSIGEPDPRWVDLYEKASRSLDVVLEAMQPGDPMLKLHDVANDYIKEVCKIAGIDEKVQGKKQLNISKENETQKIRRVESIYPKYELVTSHIGRRSFATNYYGDIPTSYLIYVTGHSSEVMFLNYIGKSNKDMALELTKYF